MGTGPVPPASAAEAAWRTAVADEAYLHAARDLAERAVRGHRPPARSKRAEIQAAIGWPISLEGERAAHEAWARIEQGAAYRVVMTDLRDAQQRAQTAREAAWAAWCADDPTVATTLWTRPALRAIGPKNPLTEALHAALLDAVVAGHCGEAEIWAAITMLRAPIELMAATWSRAMNDWRTDPARVSAVWAPLVQAVLHRTEPRGKGARALWTRWRAGAVQVLARHGADPAATAIIATQITGADPTHPLTEEELRTLPTVSAMSIAQVLTLVARVPVPAYQDGAWPTLDRLRLGVLSHCMAHPSRASVLWRAVWGAATTPAQYAALVVAGGFRTLGPWWMDRDVATALCRTLATVVDPYSASPERVNLEAILSLVQGHVDAAAWLGVWAAHRPTLLERALTTWRIEATQWPLAAEALVPYLTHGDANVREAAQRGVEVCAPAGTRGAPGAACGADRHATR